jgi:hypothetical protein
VALVIFGMRLELARARANEGLRLDDRDGPTLKAVMERETDPNKDRSLVGLSLELLAAGEGLLNLKGSRLLMTEGEPQSPPRVFYL